jgi:hypothetical protein
VGYCGLDKARIPLTGEEERAGWERSASEAADGPAPAPTMGSVGAEAGGTSLWGIPELADVAVDRPATDHGLWSEVDVARERAKGPGPGRNSHGGSVRTRPWGQVPGGGKDAVYLRGLRGPRR